MKSLGLTVADAGAGQTASDTRLVRVEETSGQIVVTVLPAPQVTAQTKNPAHGSGGAVREQKNVHIQE